MHHARGRLTPDGALEVLGDRPISGHELRFVQDRGRRSCIQVSGLPVWCIGAMMIIHLRKERVWHD